jgi:hypothetical protein
VIYVDKRDRFLAGNEDELRVLLEQYYEQAKKEQQMLAEKYPPNPPNDVCYHALMSGILIENSFGPMVHNYIPFFSTEYEKIFIWTHSKNDYSAIISKVSRLRAGSRCKARAGISLTCCSRKKSKER